MLGVEEQGLDQVPPVLRELRPDAVTEPVHEGDRGLVLLRGDIRPIERVEVDRDLLALGPPLLRPCGDGGQLEPEVGTLAVGAVAGIPRPFPATSERPFFLLRPESSRPSLILDLVVDRKDRHHPGIPLLGRHDHDAEYDVVTQLQREQLVHRGMPLGAGEPARGQDQGINVGFASSSPRAFERKRTIRSTGTRRRRRSAA